MENLRMVVGTKECPIHSIETVLGGDSLLQDNWSSLATRLGIASDKIKKWRKDMLLEKITLTDAISEILEAWVTQSGSGALLGTLIDSVEKCGATGVGELLRLKYNLPCKDATDNPSLEWKEVSPAYQKRVANNLQKFFPATDFSEALPKLRGTELTNLMTGQTPSLFKSTIPDTPSFYINRTILTRNIISKEIFEVDSDTPDIFLFTGLDQSELSDLAKDKLTSSTRQQLRGSVTVKFMILDQPNHFEKIFKKSGNQPVHLIRKEMDGRLRWIKSEGSSMAHLQQLVNPVQEELEKETFCSSLDGGAEVICISDSPGMGKSTLLGQIATKLSKMNPDKSIFFTVLSDFIKQLKQVGTVKKPKLIVEALQTSVCLNPVGEAVLQYMLHSQDKEGPISVELLLDGFDEVDSADLEMAYDVLKTIKNGFKQVRMWITSRPHLLHELENNLTVLGYNIRGFSEDHQIQFLSSFWSRNAQLDPQKSQKFARRVLKSLKSRMTSFDQDIAGIPLQCLLIADAFEEDALDYAGLGNNSSFAVEIEIGTITTLYRRLIKKKILKYESTYSEAKLSEQEVMAIHVKLSLELLFPEEIEELGLLTAPVEINIAEVLKVGLVESSSTTHSPKFMHRTIAEYLVAWYVVEWLRQGEPEWDKDKTNFLFEHALERRPLPVDISPVFRLNSYEFSYPVICYFLNSLITDVQIKGDTYIPTWVPPEEIAHACANADFANLFNFFDKLELFSSFDDKLVFLTIQKSSLEIVKPTLARFEEDEEQEFNGNMQAKVLRMAVQRGEFFIVEYLIKVKHLRKIVTIANPQTKTLVHDCVTKSQTNSDLEIESKTHVLRLLLGINRELLEVNDELDRTPLLSPDVHVRLLTELVSLGANVVAQNNSNDTIIHLNSDRYEMSPENYHTLVMSIPEEQLKKLIRVKGSWDSEDTPLTRLLRRMDPKPETLDMFRKVGADFNEIDDDGNSTFSTAICEGRNRASLQKLVQLGANMEWRKEAAQETLLHIAAEEGNVDAVGLLLGESKIGVNDIDVWDHTPMDYALKSGYLDPRRLATAMALFEKGGVSKVVINSDYQSILHIAVEEGNLQAAQLLIDLGEDVNRVGKEDNTPLHLLAQYYSWKNPDYFDILQLLLENKANASKANDDKETPFQVALKNPNLDLKAFQLLKTRSAVAWNRRVACDVMLFAFGPEKGFSIEDLAALLTECETHGADRSWKDEKGYSLLHNASKNGNKSAAHFLLGRGADINLRATSYLTQTPLHLAALREENNNNLEVIKYLIENGADVHAKDKEHRTFLDYILLQGSPSPGEFHLWVEFLVEKGLSDMFNTPGGYFERTSLHLAVKYLELEERTLTLLHSNSVDFNLVDKEGNSLLTYAIWGSRSRKFLSTLINLFGVDPTILNEHNRSLLYFAATSGTLEALELFLDLGEWDVNEEDEDGNTPLLWTLLKYEYDYDNSGDLEYYVDDNYRDNRIYLVEKCKLLIDRGADVYHANSKGKLPLDVINEWVEEDEKYQLNSHISEYSY